ncbi:Rv2231c family pyridoxal phosphate-dependent protein CobC [Actinacidiphila sp. SB3-2]
MTDAVVPLGPDEAVLRPPSLVAGVGAVRGVPADAVLELLEQTLDDAGLSVRSLTALATVDAKANEPGLISAAGRLGVPLRTYPAETLCAVDVPHPSDRVRALVGTPSVAEAAALSEAARSGSEGVELVVPKAKSGGSADTGSTGGAAGAARSPVLATVAVARRGTGSGPPPSADFPGGGGTRDAGTRMSAETTMDEPTRSVDEPRQDTHDLRHHGDAEVRGVGAELTDLAVNVRTGTPPAWLRSRIAESLDTLAAYPDGGPARRAVAERHGMPEEGVLLTAGAAEAFVLLARALGAAEPVVVHPQFTEPEAALRDAGHAVRRVLLRAEDGFRLDPGNPDRDIPESADLVVIGNPTNPTSVLHPEETLRALARPGRSLIVDEAFIDAVPGERASLVPALASGTLPGRVLVLRSLTKTWGLAGLRIGYVLSDPDTVRLLAAQQPLWPVSAPALVAARACCEQRALAEAEAAARQIAEDRAHLLGGLAEFGGSGLSCVTPPEGPFLLVHHPEAARIREELRTLGYALRRGDTFPGLDPEWLRVAVRGPEITEGLLAALGKVL